MQSNRMLAKIVKGRTIANANVADNSKLAISFDDGSIMQIKIPANSIPAVTDFKGLTVNGVQQESTTLRLLGLSKKFVDVSLNEETSSVILRDKNGTLEYAD